MVTFQWDEPFLTVWNFSEHVNSYHNAYWLFSMLLLVSLHIRSMWETTVMHKQVSGCTVNFGPKFPESPFLESQTRKPPHFGKLQIWDDQSLLRNTPPPILENFRFGMTKVYSGIPSPFWKTSDLGWPKFTSEYPPPNFGKLQIWDDQSLLWNTPPHFGKLQIWNDQSLLRNTPHPISENFRFGMTKVYSGIPLPFWKTSDLGWPKFTPKYPPPHFGKLQIWDDQSLLWNTPPFWETSDLGWPKFTLEYPPPAPESLRMPRVTTCGDFIQPG